MGEILSILLGVTLPADEVVERLPVLVAESIQRSHGIDRRIRAGAHDHAPMRGRKDTRGSATGSFRTERRDKPVLV